MQGYLITMIIVHTLTAVGSIHRAEDSVYPSALLLRALIFVGFCFWTVALLVGGAK